MPNLLVFAGPNGSGKSTITSKITIIGQYTNADLIERELHMTSEEAAKNVEVTREMLLANGADFTMETVLSTERYLNLMDRARDAGYYVSCIYVLTCDPEINVSRVIQRAKKGYQAFIDPDKVRIRYKRGLKLIPRLLDVCNELYVFDNSPERGKETPTIIAKMVHGDLKVFPNDIWPAERLQALLSGTYPDRFLATEQ